MSFDFFNMDTERPSFFEKRNSLLTTLGGGKVDDGTGQPLVVLTPLSPQQPQPKTKIGKLTIEERRIKVQRFREKRERRKWKKTIEY